jgi:signal transduction histidine kinase/CheY-like chemotaxis protein
MRRLGRAAVITAALVLVALTWLGARDAIRAHRSEAGARVRAELATRATSFEEQLQRDLLSLDQTLRILEYDWEHDPAHFDLPTRAGQVVVLNDVSLQIFTADAQGIVRTSTRPAIIGTDVSKRDYFRYKAALPADDDKMFVGGLTQGQVTRQWQLNLVRRLDNADGSFAGIVAASYDANALVRFRRDVLAGIHGVIGLVSSLDGQAWTLSEQEPNVVGIGDTPLFAAIQASKEGSWRGQSGLDNTDRMYAFATIPDRDLAVVVGVDRSEAMSGSAAWERDAVLFAGAITLLMLLLAWLMLRALDSARVRTEALARERAILEATLTGMSDGIMMVDSDLRLVAWNQRFPEFTGVPAEILRVGLPMEDILRSQVERGEFGPVDIEAEVLRRMTLLRSGASMGTVERPRPSGRQLEIRRNPLPGGGFVTLYSDVTARRQAEERMRQAQTMAAVGRLTAGVAHDFNNLLISISGNAEILYAQLTKVPEQARRLGIIMQSASRGSDLVQRLLAFARKQALAPTAVDLNQLVRGMRDLLASTLGRSIRVETALNESLWLALADPVQIEHVILNLAINARDAMPEGGTLTIATANTTVDQVGSMTMDIQAGDYVAVTVSDTGTGMPEDVLRNAFEPFFTTKPPGQGSGLGLSQVYGVANQSGGGVRIDSKLGAGTSVHVLLPRAEPDGVPLTGLERAAGASERQQPPRRHTILLVDDEPECRETISDMLRTNGFLPIAVASGEDALRLVDRGVAFDLLLVDYTMPGMTGLELARQVRSRRPAAPVVFLTGGDGDWVSDERWVLTKPFLARSLVEIVNAALGQQLSGDSIRQATTHA